MSHVEDAAEVLAGFVSIGDAAVPDHFADFVAERVAARPSPTPPADPLQTINEKLDEILTLLRGGTPE